MPTIFDNIEKNLLDGLKKALQVAERSDFCVGYLNLRGWRSIAPEVNALHGQQGIAPCRLIVGMSPHDDRAVHEYHSQTSKQATNKVVSARKIRYAESLVQQLTYGVPNSADEAGLCELAKQLRNGKLSVKFFGAYRLHAKLYLAYRDDTINPIIGYVGSSNLTLAGLEKQGELNVDVLERDAAAKLAEWFEQRWKNNWCLDITEELADIIENSWAGGPIPPYQIYIKTAYELSREAIEGARAFKVPAIFDKTMLDFQKQAVSLAAERLNRHRGVIISDVVGLGKTLVATAVAKTFQEDRGDNVLVICPPKLKEMWQGYLYDYKIAGKTLSLAQTSQLKDMRRYRLVIIDESHNLRNRDSRRYSHVLDYLRQNESRVILLTATPYNKQFTDIGNQLRLFIEADADLGIRPEEYISLLGGANYFKQKHPSTLITSLAAFEQSESVDDWRELMRMFMVRRTRNHVKKNYSKYDESRQQHYLTFADDTRFYFPHRIAKCAKFSLNAGDDHDQYAQLYSREVVDAIGALRLPRYGIGTYLLPQYQAGSPPKDLTEDQKKIIKNLSRAGKRLIGFARSGLFKRLESSGPAFILSIKRYIVRNAVYLSALETNGRVPIGDIFSSLTDEAIEEEPDLLPEEWWEESELERFLESGKSIYKMLARPDGRLVDKFQWIEADSFNNSLKDDLLMDCHVLLGILKMTPYWDADADRKLGALATLCGETYKTEKLLIFTQFKDTADYLHRELKNRGITQLAKVFGGMDDISEYVKRFSPVSNNFEANAVNELRVMITTDTLSEGQNLQDARIIINFDLPWALIRLIQRAGRVDRIGQQAQEILCYCFLPEDGIENIISLHRRLQNRIHENAELIGSDEKFFEGDTVNLQQVYDETISLDEQEDETDLISRAYNIWRQAITADQKLENKIKNLPDVVYSTKHSNSEPGAIAYIKTNNNQHILAQINVSREVVSQSQSKILSLLACEPPELLAQSTNNHHELIAAAVKHVRKGQADIGGQLGGKNSIRHRVYNQLNSYLSQMRMNLDDVENLKQAIGQIYEHPLKETARDQLARQMRTHIEDDELARMVEALHINGELCATPKAGEPLEPHIICSMGLIP